MDTQQEANDSSDILRLRWLGTAFLTLDKQERQYRYDAESEGNAKKASGNRAGSGRQLRLR